MFFQNLKANIPPIHWLRFLFRYHIFLHWWAQHWIVILFLGTACLPGFHVLPFCGTCSSRVHSTQPVSKVCMHTCSEWPNSKYPQSESMHNIQIHWLGMKKRNQGFTDGTLVFIKNWTLMYWFLSKKWTHWIFFLNAYAFLGSCLYAL